MTPRRSSKEAYQGWHAGYSRAEYELVRMGKELSANLACVNLFLSCPPGISSTWNDCAIRSLAPWDKDPAADLEGGCASGADRCRQRRGCWWSRPLWPGSISWAQLS